MQVPALPAMVFITGLVPILSAPTAVIGHDSA